VHVSARSVLPPKLSEASWQRVVIELAEHRQWSVWHDQDTRRNRAGLPDLLLVRGDRFMARELKTDTGRVRPEQKAWLDGLAAAGVDSGVWRPADWDRVQAELR
jgi:hypothetical protein